MWFGDKGQRLLSRSAMARHRIMKDSLGRLTGLIRRPTTQVRRRYSVKPDDIRPEASQKARGRVERVNARLPRFLQRYTKPLIDAPLTHISAFLLLHELTAVLPLIGLIATFHYTHWMPPFVSNSKWVSEGVEKFGRYFRKKGWLGEEGVAKRERWWSFGEGGTRIVVE